MGAGAPALGTAVAPASPPPLEGPVTPQLPPAATAAPGDLMPTVSASDLPRARPTGHGRYKARMTGPAAATGTAAAAGAEAAPVAVTAPAAATASAAAPADTAAAPEDSAASLVPVIPSAAPPPADPLVKAVQDDIEGK